MKFQIDYNTMNLTSAADKLKVVLSVLVESSQTNPAIGYVDENLLHRIVVAESSKAYHTKLVDQENKEGYFVNYKSLCETISDIILELNPDYIYPHALASSLIEMANTNIYFAEHIPALTDITVQKGDQIENVRNLLSHVAFAAINTKKEL